MTEEKTLSYTTTNSYVIKNEFTEKTRNIWIVFHGLGHLSQYFIEHFKDLNPDQNYIVAPQAPSLYYQDKRYKYVGACWLTRENRESGIANIHNFLDALYEKEVEPKLNSNTRLIVFGFSQGVSVAMRWLFSRKLICSQLILNSGSIPREFDTGSFKTLIESKPHLVYGADDSLITADRIKDEISYAQTLFEKEPVVTEFQGGHQVHEKILKEIEANID